MNAEPVLSPASREISNWKFTRMPSTSIRKSPVKAFEQSVLEPTFSGAAILPQGNVNWSQLADPEIDRMMAAAAPIPIGAQRNAAWAAVNRRIVERAVAIPYLWGDVFQLESEDVRGVMNGYYATWDLSFSSVK